MHVVADFLNRPMFKGKCCGVTYAHMNFNLTLFATTAYSEVVDKQTNRLASTNGTFTKHTLNAHILKE